MYVTFPCIDKSLFDRKLLLILRLLPKMAVLRPNSTDITDDRERMHVH